MGDRAARHVDNRRCADQRCHRTRALEVRRPLERGPTGVQWSKELLVSFPLVRIPARLRAALPIAAALARLPSFRFEQDSAPERRVAAVGAFLDWASDELHRR